MAGIKELPSNTTRVLVAEAVIIIKLKELSSSATAMGNIFVSQEILEIEDIGQKAIDIMNKILRNIMLSERKFEEVQNNDRMQEINDMQRQLRGQLRKVQEVQPPTQEQQEKILLLEELQKAYIKINQHIQQALRYEQVVKQQLQEIKNQMHVILEIGQYEHEEHPENELREVLEQLKNQLLRTLRSLDTLSILQVAEKIYDEKTDYYYTRIFNLPGFRQKMLKFNVTTILRKSACVHQIHEHTRGKIQQEMQKLQEKAKKVERNEIMQQKLEQQLVDNIQTHMKTIQEKAKLIENQATKAWDEYYMKIACLAAQRSKDPSTPVSY